MFVRYDEDVSSTPRLCAKSYPDPDTYMRTFIPIYVRRKMLRITEHEMRVGYLAGMRDFAENVALAQWRDSAMPFVLLSLFKCACSAF